MYFSEHLLTYGAITQFNTASSTLILDNFASFTGELT